MATLFKMHEDGTREYKDAGKRIQAIAWNADRTFKEVVSNEPTVGCSLLVGSITARSYSDGDYWLTTPVTEILEEVRDEDDDVTAIRFKTENSEYLLQY